MIRINYLRSAIIFVLALLPFVSWSQARIVVAQNGSGDFKTIREAVNSVPDSSATLRIVFVKNGTYAEKVTIAKNNLLLQGEDRAKTIITGSISNVIYSIEHRDQYSGVVNLDGDDITISNMTIQNTFGKDVPDSLQYEYKDRFTGEMRKIGVGRTSHQFALRSFKSTRLKVINCNILAWGADTVSPWDSNEGMYYFKNCLMQGGVDFYCPRGWAYAEDCTFVCLSPTAAIWHDGGKDKSMKSVWNNCKFVGGPTTVSYKLGRYHHDSHFYLLNCTFDEKMQDVRIYKAATAKPVYWGPREYYYNCHRTGGDYDWFRNNLTEAPGSPSAEDITVQWTFDGKWNPLEK